MQFTLSNGTVIESTATNAWQIAGYADATLRVISGQSWVPGTSEEALPAQARILFRYASTVLDKQFLGQYLALHQDFIRRWHSWTDVWTEQELADLQKRQADLWAHISEPAKNRYVDLLHEQGIKAVAAWINSL